MELQRRRRSLGLALLVIVFGLVALVCARGSTGGAIALYAAGGVVAIALGVVLLRDELRPFRFAIGPDGITTRDGLIEWAAIDSVVLDEPVPPATSGPHLILEPGDRVVLKLQDVRQSQEQIVAALQQHSGGRLDNRIARRGPDPGFATVLRGYEPGRVDNLVRRAGDALLSGDPAERAAVRAALAEPDLVVVPRGYDRAEVERHLRRLQARLGDPAR
ncbi:hypothetical protein Dvina_26850 [Dactylosporangium vinaceum]|uniref:DivIVA domain-containing protein n=1 Tax=Dactylosporangium vinaceum TaxID=53362 RepID=A0ABV5MC12_9ACTN|nr:hypothetical protein [Dactylosporangium vinaceum]UAC01339.1 hypothetical protein Dvina_26850 [Dactylosporangium vinaceum]